MRPCDSAHGGGSETAKSWAVCTLSLVPGRGELLCATPEQEELLEAFHKYGFILMMLMQKAGVSSRSVNTNNCRHFSPKVPSLS